MDTVFLVLLNSMYIGQFELLTKCKYFTDHEDDNPGENFLLHLVNERKYLP